MLSFGKKLDSPCSGLGACIVIMQNDPQEMIVSSAFPDDFGQANTGVLIGVNSSLVLMNNSCCISSNLEKWSDHSPRSTARTSGFCKFLLIFENRNPRLTVFFWGLRFTVVSVSKVTFDPTPPPRRIRL